MNKDLSRQLLNVFGLIFALVINALATTLPLNGTTTAQISNNFPLIFTPAGYVFSIWGIIYLGLIAFTIYQALPSQRENPRLRKLGLLFLVSSLLNAFWLVSFHYLQFGTAMILMTLLLVVLVRIYLLLGIGREKVKPIEKWLVNLPFSVYLGWISVATIANAAQLLFSIKWNGFGIAPEIWTIIMLAAAVLISGLMSFARKDVGHALVLIWAFIGIAVKPSILPIVSTAAWAAAGSVGVLLLLGLLLNPSSKR